MEDMKKSGKKQEIPHQPLFKGDGARDASVSEMEKLAEMSFAIREAIEKYVCKSRNK